MSKQVQVLVDFPGMDKLLTYAIPEDLAVKIGDILTVPFGDRYVGGIAINLDPEELDDQSFEVKPIYAVVNTGLFPLYYWDTLIRTAEYYRTSLLQTVKAALPPKLLDQSSYRLHITPHHPEPHGLPRAAQVVWDFLLSHSSDSRKSSISRRFISQKLPKHAASGLRTLIARGYISSYLEPPATPKPKYEQVVVLLAIADHQVTTRQKEILTVLQRAGGELLRSELITAAKTSDGTLKNLAEQGYIAIQSRECLRLGG